MRDNFWSRLKKGDKSALIEIYKLTYADLYNYGMRISHNEELTRDCIHDLFAKIWTGKSTIQEARDPKPYMFRMLRWMIIDALKHYSPFVEVNDTELYDPIISKEDLIIEREVSDEKSEKLKSAIENLTNRQKEIVFLRFYSGLDYEEISRVTAIKYQSVRNIFSKALKELRKSFR
ncbi:MAG: sigma-70 family RNA polymerase sigma factor [Cyclobacteriaceae bacterium]